jgi:ATP-dependent Clp protease ATP-binding subunit ClpA
MLLSVLYDNNLTNKKGGKIMDWTQAIFIMSSNIALFLWARTESRSDYRETRALIDAIHAEIKDFHGRLCTIEERKKENKQ